MANFSWIPKDLFHDFLKRHLTIPDNDPDIVALTNIWKNKKGKKRKSPKSNTILNTNMHHALHPITAQHRWLRVLARTCKTMRVRVYEYRRWYSLFITPNFVYFPKEKWKSSFLTIEKNMTKQRSKHTKCVKNAMNPRHTKKFLQKLKNIQKSKQQNRLNLVHTREEEYLDYREDVIQNEVNAEYDYYNELMQRI